MKAPTRILKLSAIVICVASLLSAPAQALTLAALRADKHLTPERLLKYFANFQFELNEEVQPPEVFLARQKGDCDDFATLASDLLKERGYTPKLVVVFMPRAIHVVCYVKEIKAYLDYNNRVMANPLAPSDGSLKDIADKVAQSFGEPWNCASEYTFKNGVRHFVYTDFRQAAPPLPPAPAVSPSRVLAVIGDKK